MARKMQLNVTRYQVVAQWSEANHVVPNFPNTIIQGTPLTKSLRTFCTLLWPKRWLNYSFFFFLSQKTHEFLSKPHFICSGVALVALALHQNRLRFRAHVADEVEGHALAGGQMLDEDFGV